MNTLSSLSLAAAATLLCPSAHAQWSTDSLSEARFQMASTSLGDKAFFIGGGSCVSFAGCDPSLDSKRVDVYDAATGTWSFGDYLSQARNLPVAVTVGDLIVVAGGVTLPGTIVGTVDIYDSTLGPPDDPGAWSVDALPSVERAELAGASVGTKAMFAGGWTSCGAPGGCAEVGIVDVYDASTGTWSVEMLSVPRHKITTATVGTKVLFAGGEIGLASGSMPVDVVDIYDDSTGTWSTATLSEAKRWMSATTVGTKAMFFGGSLAQGFVASGPETSRRVEIYDDATGTWSTATLSLRRYRGAATTVGHLALFAGGRNLLRSRVDIYDDVSGTWSTAQLSQSRDALSAATAGDQALFAGGALCCSWGGTGNPTDRVDIFTLPPPLGTGYCQGNPNSTGQVGSIEGSGSNAVVNNEVYLRATGLPLQANGYFIASPVQAFTQNPGGSQGNICLGGNIGRFVSQLGNSGPSGQIRIAVDLSAVPQPNGSVAVQPGETWNFQCWHRDANPGPVSNFTTGYSIVFQ